MKRQRGGDPVERLADNLMRVETWATKGDLKRARDMLQACIALDLPAVPDERRGPWERKIRGLDERLPKTTWAGSSPPARRQPRTSPSRLPRQRSESSHGQSRKETVAAQSRVWARLARALDDRRTDFAVLACDSFRARFDFVSTPSGVQVWVTLRAPTERAWALFPGSQFIREAHAVAPRARRFLPVRRRPASSSDWLLVWMFTSIPDARVEVKDEFLASSPDQAPELTVSRHPADTHAAFDREVERLGARPYRPGQGHKRFPVTTCAKCGQPLSDPRSVVLGIGPDCLKYYDPKVLAEAREWKPGSVRSTGCTPRSFFSAITAPW